MSPLSLVPFLPRQEVTPIFSSHGGLRSRRLWGCLGCFSSVPSGAQERSGAPLPSGPPRRAPAPPTLGGPISGPSRARHNGSLAASPPEPAPEGPPAALHASFQPCPLGEGGVPRGNRLAVTAGTRAPGLLLLGAGVQGRAGIRQTRSSVTAVKAACAGELCTHAFRAPDPAPRRPRPGRAARGFHGDGKQASTASATTANFPAFHPPLGAQRDDRGAGCKERERGDSEPEPQKIAPKLV
ncbi:sterile alpha motif domain-containing protein 1-like isoform X1 [Ursus arctos]|uniref:sterile alpha motif domain-containing protein 1-like isoform X1 n=1 Tax=Ursus arctos TaxID=9644 RepID=UPI002548E57A|nr:sterile alpha motif domain-containing protein 1-like isoform X1 [Ursus arctos]